MPLNRRNLYLTAIGIGVIAGMRTFSAPAWLARAKRSRAERPLEGLASFEFVMDKLPSTPSRTVPIQLAARAGSGALTAALLPERGSVNPGQRTVLALLGASTALAIAHLAYHARRDLGQRLGVRDPFVGAAEDALTVLLASRVFGLPAAKNAA
jgi:uncharacterized membrane protein